ncbi:MAG: exodeoxyribonuclease VII large subunit [Bacteroidota bacterium]
MDVIIVTRGGGSLEDLWPFNEERVARAIYACSIPVISGVGHEIDFSISDFVADVRAATPTQAAVLATPNRQDILVGLDEFSSRVSRIIEQKWSKSAQRVEFLAKSHALRKVQERWNLCAAQHAQAHQRIDHRMESVMQRRKTQWQDWSHRLDRRNPNVALEQGYTRIWQNNQWIKSKEMLAQDQSFDVEFNDGRATLSKKD